MIPAMFRATEALLFAKRPFINSTTLRSAAVKTIFLLPLSSLLFVLAAAGQVQTDWTGAADSRWNNPANWTAGVPESRTTVVRFTDAGKSREVVVEGSSTFQQLVFQGHGKMPYILTGGALVLDRTSEGNCLQDASTRDNTIHSDIEIKNAAGNRTPSMISKWKASGVLLLSGTVTTSTVTFFAARDGGNLVIDGDLVGAEDPESGAFNQHFMAMEDGAITIQGSGVSSNTGSGTVIICLGDHRSGGMLNLNRTAAIAGGMILMINPETASLSAINLGADNAIVNDPGKLRIQTAADGQSVVLNTHGHALDLSNKSLGLFPFGSASAIFKLDLGEEDSQVRFASSETEHWRGTLAILNFTKGRDTIRFGEDDLGLTADQLACITINGGSGVGIDAQGFLVPPEP